MPRSWLSDDSFESFLSIIISWVPALGIIRLTLFLSPLITIRADDEGHYCILGVRGWPKPWQFGRGRDPGGLGTRSLLYALALGLGPVDFNTHVRPVN
jgi:hypothetical protein